MGQRNARPRHRQGRSRGDPLAELPSRARGFLRRAIARRGPHADELPPRPRRLRVHPESRRSEGADRRAGPGALDRAQPAEARDRGAARARKRRGAQRIRRVARLRVAPRELFERSAAPLRGRRERCFRASLHVRHDGAAEGRDARPLQHHPLRDDL